MQPIYIQTDIKMRLVGADSTVSTSICASVHGLLISAIVGEPLERATVSPTDALEEAVLHTQWAFGVIMRLQLVAL
jgi:hypothetical protein